MAWFLIDYYETARPHQGLSQRIPVPRQQLRYSGPVRQRKILGGIINDYYRAPANTPLYLN